MATPLSIDPEREKREVLLHDAGLNDAGHGVIMTPDTRCCARTPTGKRCRMPVSARRPETGVCETHDLSDRVACPIDPSHTVRLSKLSVHVHVCSSKQCEQPWLVKNVNVPNVPSLYEDEQPLADGARAAPPDRTPLSLLASLEAARAALNVGEAPMEVIVPEALAEYVESAPPSKHNKECAKHRLQYASIVGHILRLMSWHNQAVPMDGVWFFFELGAGSGFLSGCLRQVVGGEGNTFVLVDRSAPPHRRGDRQLRKEAMGRSVHRGMLYMVYGVFRATPRLMCAASQRISSACAATSQTFGPRGSSTVLSGRHARCVPVWWSRSICVELRQI
jgi:tRNA:m4X modification enzyme